MTGWGEAGDPLLTVAEMGRADAETIASGTPGIVLMENAGAAIASEIMRRWAPRPATILCGPGNNGGDGYVVARLLAEKGWEVTVLALGDPSRLRGDAALAAERWDGGAAPLTGEERFGAGDLVVDALFGAGLARPLEGPARSVIEGLSGSSAVVVAVDVPSGIDGDTGEIRGTAADAALTVTFCCAKLGHVLLPGRLACGEVVFADIGIPDSGVAGLGVAVHRNGPALWGPEFPRATLTGHKYSRGHALVVGGGATTSGAARMAARGALRVGAGLVTTIAPADALPIYAAHQTAVMLDDITRLGERLADPRHNAVLIGPGCGVDDATARHTLDILTTGKPCVIDADAISCLQNTEYQILDSLYGDCVLTPHEGEFARVFDYSGDKLTRARAAAAETGAVVVLKGGDTVIVAPDGRAAINDNAPPWLATAGAGDVLAGFILGLQAQGMPSYAAACAATWLHGAVASSLGPGMIAEDLPEALPTVLKHLGEK